MRKGKHRKIDLDFWVTRTLEGEALGAYLPNLGLNKYLKTYDYSIRVTHDSKWIRTLYHAAFSQANEIIFYPHIW